MRNAHLRLGRLEYLRSTERVQTKIHLHVDRYMGEKEQGHLLSVYGGDAEVGAIAAAVHEKHPFSLTFPDGKAHRVTMGEDASCYRSGLTVPGRKHDLRHLICVSLALHANGAAGKTFLLNYSRSQAWPTLVSLLGLPADPRWGNWALDRLEADGQIIEIEGIGCDPVVVVATRGSLMERVAEGLDSGELVFPEKNGPILWPSFRPQDALRSTFALL